LVAGGYFRYAEETHVRRIAAWDGSNWSPLGNGLNNIVLVVASHDGDLYAGGLFDAAGEVAANRIAKWDGVEWSPLGAGVDDRVEALASYGDYLVVGGVFSDAGAGDDFIVRWDGESFSAMGSGVNGPVHALAVSDSILYVGGTFENAGGKKSTYIARWNDPEAWAISATMADLGPVSEAASFVVENFPNPFNPKTTISCFVPEPCAVTVEIFNVQGQHVKTLKDGSVEAGRHAVEWDGTGATGSSLPSGVYFCKISCGGVEASKKLVLLD
jgi:hypothetical protein